MGNLAPLGRIGNTIICRKRTVELHHSAESGRTRTFFFHIALAACLRHFRADFAQPPPEIDVGEPRAEITTPVARCCICRGPGVQFKTVAANLNILPGELRASLEFFSLWRASVSSFASFSFGDDRGLPSAPREWRPSFCHLLSVRAWIFPAKLPDFAEARAQVVCLLQAFIVVRSSLGCFPEPCRLRVCKCIVLTFKPSSSFALPSEASLRMALSWSFWAWEKLERRASSAC